MPIGKKWQTQIIEVSLTKGLYFTKVEERLRESIRDGEALRAFTSPRSELATGRNNYQTPARAVAFH